MISPEHWITIKNTLKVNTVRPPTLEIDDTIPGAEVIRLGSETEIVSAEKWEFIKNNLEVNKVLIPTFEKDARDLFSEIQLDQNKKKKEKKTERLVEGEMISADKWMKIKNCLKVNSVVAPTFNEEEEIQQDDSSSDAEPSLEEMIEAANLSKIKTLKEQKQRLKLRWKYLKQQEEKPTLSWSRITNDQLMRELVAVEKKITQRNTEMDEMIAPVDLLHGDLDKGTNKRVEEKLSSYQTDREEMDSLFEEISEYEDDIDKFYQHLDVPSTKIEKREEKELKKENQRQQPKRKRKNKGKGRRNKQNPKEKKNNTNATKNQCEEIKDCKLPKAPECSPQQHQQQTNSFLMPERFVRAVAATACNEQNELLKKKVSKDCNVQKALESSPQQHQQQRNSFLMAERFERAVAACNEQNELLKKNIAEYLRYRETNKYLASNFYLNKYL